MAKSKSNNKIMEEEDLEEKFINSFKQKKKKRKFEKEVDEDKEYWKQLTNPHEEN